MGPSGGTSGEAQFVVFDYYGSASLARLLRSWGLDVSSDNSIARRGHFGTPHVSSTMLAYLTAAPDGAQRIHVDADSGPDLVGRLMGHDEFKLRSEQTETQPVQSGEWHRISSPGSQDDESSRTSESWVSFSDTYWDLDRQSAERVDPFQHVADREGDDQETSEDLTIDTEKADG